MAGVCPQFILFTGLFRALSSLEQSSSEKIKENTSLDRVSDAVNRCALQGRGGRRTRSSPVLLNLACLPVSSPWHTSCFSLILQFRELSNSAKVQECVPVFLHFCAYCLPVLTLEPACPILSAHGCRSKPKLSFTGFGFGYRICDGSSTVGRRTCLLALRFFILSPFIGGI